MKAYLLSCGSYSDYSVIAVFSTRGAAEAVLARHPKSDSAEVEERDLDPGVLHARDGYFRFQVEMDRDTGNIHREPFEAYPDADDLGTEVNTGSRPPNEKFPWALMNEWIPTLRITCWAHDIAHAVKIASEHRRQLLALPASADAVDPHACSTGNKHVEPER